MGDHGASSLISMPQTVETRSQGSQLLGNLLCVHSVHRCPTLSQSRRRPPPVRRRNTPARVESGSRGGMRAGPAGDGISSRKDRNGEPPGPSRRARLAWSAPALESSAERGSFRMRGAEMTRRAPSHAGYRSQQREVRPTASPDARGQDCVTLVDRPVKAEGDPLHSMRTASRNTPNPAPIGPVGLPRRARRIVAACALSALWAEMIAPPRECHAWMTGTPAAQTHPTPASLS